MSFHQTSVSGFPAVALRSELLELVVVPSIGCKITNLRRRRGREWLWRSTQIPLAAPEYGASYVETADSGGWDECFPTVAPSPIPGAGPGAPALPDHGELWALPWSSQVYRHAGGTTLAGRVVGRVLPYEFEREVTLDPHEPLVRFRYRLRHTGSEPFRWIWSSHPLLNVQPGSVLELPSVSRARVDVVHGRSDVERGGELPWPPPAPGETSGSPGAAFVFPDEGAGWAMKLFADVGPSGKMTLTDPRSGERLEIRVDPSSVPQVGIWLNLGGWAPSGKRPYYNLALEPCIGAPDSLADAVERWGTAMTLEPTEERRWEVAVALFDADE
ncbi:MAG TPA: hypothetical protein VNK43_02350 [Gemmatimonadales bacterium]|nr:hypothetical protein [Gemmatimonadales bacterium]